MSTLYFTLVTQSRLHVKLWQKKKTQQQQEMVQKLIIVLTRSKLTLFPVRAPGFDT